MYLTFNHVGLKTYPWLADKMDENDYTNLTGLGLGATVNGTGYRHSRRDSARTMLMTPNESAIAAQRAVSHGMDPICAALSTLVSVPHGPVM